jgi:Holliday junction resolvase-like predicted endonuclease
LAGAPIDDLLDDERSGTAIRASDVEKLLDEICAADSKEGWTKGLELDLGAKKWRPSAVSSSSGRLLYVFLQESLPRYAIERLRLARAAEIDITVALPISALFQPDVLEVLVEIDSDVLVIDDYQRGRRNEQRHLLAAIADIEVPLAPDIRRRVGATIWPRIADGSNHAKGRRLEAVLAFLFSQVKDFKVVERNYRNESEEIDLVLQIDNFSKRAWQNSGVPFILVEAKNRADKASQQMMSVLLTKLQTKRGTARLGFMVSIAGFSDEAKIQELRFSTENICVVMIDGANLEMLLLADDLDEALETLVRRAFLR